MSNLKIAAITGAGTGIGRAASVALARAGYTIVCLGRRSELLRETLSRLEGEGHSEISLDVVDFGAVANVFAQIEHRYGQLDLLFNNAGGSCPAVPLDEADPVALREVLNSIALGSLLCAQAAFGIMRRQHPSGGRIINNGSVSAHAPRPNMAAYTMAKHAITGLTKSLNLDGRAYSITASQIDIGNAASERTERMTAGVLQADGVMRAEPRIELEHVTRAIVHMAALPLEANIPFLTIMPSTMPLYGRG